MNLYKGIGYAVATPEALALAERLADWHDQMVAHQRRDGAARGRHCDDDCPHAEAAALWTEAVAVFGVRAEAFAFLRAHGLASRRFDGSRRTAGAEARA